MAFASVESERRPTLRIAGKIRFSSSCVPRSLILRPIRNEKHYATSPEFNLSSASRARMSGTGEGVKLDLTGAVVQDVTGVTLTGTQIVVEPTRRNLRLT